MDNDKSIANYYLGCSAMEKQNYSDAVQYFDNVIRFGEKANQIYLGWAYIECGKLYMRKGVFEESKRYYYIGKDILLKQDSEEEMLNASLTFVKTLYDENQLKEAMRCTSELLTEINDLKLRERVEKSYKELLDVETKKSSTKDFNIENACPEEIAMEAQRLHENPEKREVAWKLIKLAKEKYKKNGNIAGVGRCENNMGCFCISENKGLDAVGYFKKALDIKKSLGDVKGVINQIVGILFLYINNSDMKSAEQVVAYALNLLPQYEYVAEKYSLFFVLTIYYFKQQHFAEALYYGKLAEKGLPYLRETGRLRAEMLSEILVQIEKLFDTKRVSVSTHSDYFEAELAEATRLFKIGKFQECCNMLEELSKETGEDYFRQGQIKGTLANACLHEKHYEDALTNFMAAKSLFDTLQEKGNNDIREHFYTVLNGATIALDGLGRVDESIELLRRELEINNQTKQGRFSLTISLCNRLLTARREEIKKGTQLFEEILERLNAQKIDELSHEKRGIVYCAFGNLYNVVSDKTIAKEYYQLAKEEFLISNSPHISAVEQMLKSI